MARASSVRPRAAATAPRPASASAGLSEIARASRNAAAASSYWPSWR